MLRSSLFGGYNLLVKSNILVLVVVLLVVVCKYSVTSVACRQFKMTNTLFFCAVARNCVR